MRGRKFLRVGIFLGYHRESLRAQRHRERDAPAPSPLYVDPYNWIALDLDGLACLVEDRPRAFVVQIEEPAAVKRYQEALGVAL